MLQKKCFMVFERYIPELKKYDCISFLHQPMTSGQPLKIIQRHMAHPVGNENYQLFLISMSPYHALNAETKMASSVTILIDN